MQIKNYRNTCRFGEIHFDFDETSILAYRFVGVVCFRPKQFPTILAQPKYCDCKMFRFENICFIR